MTNAPRMNPYAHHVLLCTGRHCDPDGKAAALYHRLPHMLADLALYDNPHRVKRGTSPCLGACCNRGPLLVIYPAGVWYHRVDADLLQQIIALHLRGGQPLWEHIFHTVHSEVDHDY